MPWNSGKDLSRERLVTALEGLYEYDTGLMPKITFGPNRRIGSVGRVRCHGRPRKKLFPASVEWIAVELNTRLSVYSPENKGLNLPRVQSVRVTTYNIHKCMGLDRRVRPKRIAEVLKEIDADVVALQEVAGMDEAAREHNHVHAIAEELGMDFASVKIGNYAAGLTEMQS